MSKFAARVELRKATAEDYEKLRVEMEERGFSRLLRTCRGARSLP